MGADMLYHLDAIDHESAEDGKFIYL